MVLPAHLIHCARLLRNEAAVDNPLTDVQARPLVNSTALWLMRNGTINKEDSPGVIQKAGDLLHDIIPVHLLQVRKGAGRATDFTTRIAGFLQNHVTKTTGTFKLEVPHDEPLSTPLKALETAGLLTKLEPGELPPQGHSGRSIIGAGRLESYETRASPIAQPPASAKPNAASLLMALQASSSDSNGKPTTNDILSYLKMVGQQQGLDVSIPPHSWGIRLIYDSYISDHLIQFV